jgi:hypothetical protein
MTPATFTLALVVLMFIAGVLGALVGWAITKLRMRGLADRAAREAFDLGADVDDKMRKLGERARRLGR